jgi:hypothetical protein
MLPGNYAVTLASLSKETTKGTKNTKLHEAFLGKQNTG